MGLLTIGHPLDWEETKKHSEKVKKTGIEQFIKLYKTFSSRDSDCFKYGDEVEYSMVKFDHKHKRVYLLLKAQQLIDTLNESTNSETKWTPEFGSFMLEGLPGSPYEHDIESIVKIESNMNLRRKQVHALLETNEHVMTFSVFPLLGCPDFTYPATKPTPGQGITSSIFFPDDAVFQGHPRYATSLINNRARRKSNTSTNIPIYFDINTPKPFEEDLAKYGRGLKAAKSKPDHIFMDGMGGLCSCLQVTFQAKNMEEARLLYDQLTPITPIVLALSAASPIWRGFLADIDCRWKVISDSLDDRTAEEKGELPLKTNTQRIFKSRYDSVDCYLTRDGAKYNDIEIVKHEGFFKELVASGVDELMAQHVSHLFIRDPLVIYKENLCTEADDEFQTDHFENIQSTNWQSMRFKPPPCADSNSKTGWRVEFRTTELQVTDFENAAFVSFLVLLTRTILTFGLDFLIPISKVDENMNRAQKRDACLKERFYFR